MTLNSQTLAFQWVKEIERVKSLDDLITPKSLTGKDFPDYEELDLMMAAALKRCFDKHTKIPSVCMLSSEFEPVFPQSFNRQFLEFRDTLRLKRTSFHPAERETHQHLCCALSLGVAYEQVFHGALSGYCLCCTGRRSKDATLCPSQK